MKPTPPITAWAVQARGRAPSNRFWIVQFTIRPKRTEALAAFMAMWAKGPVATWDYWSRRGYRLVKVAVFDQEPGHGE